MEYGVEKCLLCKRQLNEDEQEEGICARCGNEDANTRSKHKEKQEKT